MTIEAKGDPIKCLSAIKGMNQNFQDSKCPIVTVHKAITDFFQIEQGEKEGLPVHAKRFKCAQGHVRAAFWQDAINGAH